MKKIEENKVDVLIPVHNEEKNLKICLKYLKTQRLLNKIIIIDDFSTDNSVEIAKMYNSKIISPKKSIEERQSWAAEMLNYGLDFIETKFFLKLDADIIILKDFIYNCVKFIEKGKNLYSVSGVVPPIYPNWFKMMNLIYQIYPRGGARLYNTEILKKIGGFVCDELQTEDSRRDVLTKRGEDVCTDILASNFHYYKGIARKARGWHLRPAKRHLKFDTPNKIEKIFFMALYFKFKDLINGLNVIKTKIQNQKFELLIASIITEIKSLIIRLSFRIISSEKTRIWIKNHLKMEFSGLKF